NRDPAGGVMFPMPAAPLDAGLPKRQGFKMARWSSRVGGQPEVDGMIPSSTMAQEVLTRGERQGRAMILLMTNPLRSALHSARLEKAFAGLDFLVAIDFYINESTRYADVILPTPPPAELASYELGFYHLSVRNVAKWSRAAVSPPPGAHASWQARPRLRARLLG